MTGDGFWRREGHLSRRTWAELAYALSGVFVVVAAAAYVLVMFGAGLALLVPVAGVALLGAMIAGARRFADLERARARALLGVVIAAPAAPKPRRGFLSWSRAWLADRAGWRAVLYPFAKLPVAIVAVAAGLLWPIGLAELTYPIWYHFGAASQDGANPAGQVVGGVRLDTWPRIAAVAVVGAVLLLVAPWVVRAATRLDARVTRAILGTGGR
ncbi:sensor domain-containing protein [Phytohabitans kaempferiae]|uniref:Sensor domain-containing protein n=1 Tax=Phytohabitans kaempferiae TaxID=1620943 RepID=A0ABV6MB41_9ACTN